MIVHLPHVDLAMESLLLNSLKNQSSSVHLFVIIKTRDHNHKANNFPIFNNDKHMIAMKIIKQKKLFYFIL